MTLSKDEMRAYQHVWMWKRRLAWIAENGPCQLCGNMKVEELVVTHRPKEQVAIRITSLWSRRAEVRAQELAKCWVLCFGCHQICLRFRRRIKPLKGVRHDAVDS